MEPLSPQQRRAVESVLRDAGIRIDWQPDLPLMEGTVRLMTPARDPGCETLICQRWARRRMRRLAREIAQPPLPLLEASCLRQ